MRHQRKVKKLNRPRPHRLAMLANLATSLFANRRIETTHARATELRRVADRLISIAKTGTLAAQRQVARVIRHKKTHKKLFTEIVPHFQSRTSGFTRILKKGIRRGDGSIISIVELLTPKPEPTPETAKEAPGKRKSTAPGETKPRATAKKSAKKAAKSAVK